MPRGIGRPQNNNAEIFWSRAMQGPDCWPWQGQILPNGYGVFPWRSRYKQQKTYAHRIAWELANDATIPPGMQICHHCDVRDCVNPSHLFLGTAKDNMQDMARKGRSARGQYTPEQIDHIRAIRYQFLIEKIPLTEIARQRGLMVQWVWKIVHRKRYATVA